jgi:hypothetical protein
MRADLDRRASWRRTGQRDTAVLDADQQFGDVVISRSDGVELVRFPVEYSLVDGLPEIDCFPDLARYAQASGKPARCELRDSNGAAIYSYRDDQWGYDRQPNAGRAVDFLSKEQFDARHYKNVRVLKGADRHQGEGSTKITLRSGQAFIGASAAELERQLSTVEVIHATAGTTTLSAVSDAAPFGWQMGTDKVTVRFSPDLTGETALKLMDVDGRCVGAALATIWPEPPHPNPDVKRLFSAIEIPLSNRAQIELLAELPSHTADDDLLFADDDALSHAAYIHRLVSAKPYEILRDENGVLTGMKRGDQVFKLERGADGKVSGYYVAT